MGTRLLLPSLLRWGLSSAFLLLLLSALPAQADIGGWFQLFAVTGVSGISTALTRYKTVILMDRTDSDNTHAHLPNGQPAYAEEFAVNSNYFRPLDVVTNIFCTTGQFTEDGSLLTLGGTTNDPTVQLLDGASSVRAFYPCEGGEGATCDFQVIGELTSRRWYPTSQILPDGRIFVVGGANTIGNQAINNYMVNNPTYEFWPRGDGEGNYQLGILQDQENLLYNLYPFVHLLPSGNLFIFAGQLSCILNYWDNTVVRDLPRLQAPGAETVYRNYPVTGTSALFALKPDDGYTAQVLICGGNTKDANLLSMNGNDCPGCWIPATSSCATIYPDSNDPQWSYEWMPTARVMPDAVLLLDDTILITNGAGVGFQGLSQTYASAAVTVPVVYDTRAEVGQRFQTVNADSGIPRMYHSSALLMPDGSVLISGSNPNTQLTNDGAFPTQFQTQLFFPHYNTWNVQRNALTAVPNSIAIGQNDVQISFTTTIATPDGLSDNDRYRVVLVNPGFSTHSERHGMRNVFLQVTNVQVTPSGAAGVYTASRRRLLSAEGNRTAGASVEADAGADVDADMVERDGLAEMVVQSVRQSRRELRVKGHHKKGEGHHGKLSHGYLGTHGRNWQKRHHRSNSTGGNSKAGGSGNSNSTGSNSNTGGVSTKQQAGDAGQYTVTLTVNAPPNGNIAPAGHYWLHVIDQGGFRDSNGQWQAGNWVPNWEGAVVHLTR